MIGMLTTLALSAAPALGRLFAGDKGEEIGQGVASIAQGLTGEGDQDKAAAALQANPELLVRFNAQINQLAVKELEEETKRLGLVNATMQQELQIGANVQNRMQFFLALWKSGWRPLWGWVSGVAFGVQILGNMVLMCIAVLDDSVDAVEVIASLATFNGSLVAIWGFALAVLGVSVHKRSKDKELTTGMARAAGGVDLSGARAALSSVLSKTGGK